MIDGTLLMERSPLFPGHDQLKEIFKLLGTPSDEDVDCFNSDALKRLCSFRASFVNCAGEGLRNRFCRVGEKLVSMLEAMLKFNPKQRIATDVALEHDLFSEIRDQRLEIVASSQISLKFEQDSDLNETLLRRYWCKEFQQILN